MSKNDITQDKLISKPSTEDYRENWDRIFNKCKVCGKNLGNGFAAHTCRKEKHDANPSRSE